MGKSLLGGANDTPADDVGGDDPAVGGGADGAGADAGSGADDGAPPSDDPPADPSPTGDGAGDDGAGDDDGDGKLTLEEWQAKQREGVPESPEGYVIPEIEGLDKEEWEKSPAFATLRSAAHKAGLAPEAFNEFVGDYVAAQVKEVDDAFAAEMSALGPDKAAVDLRVKNVVGFLNRSLPAGEAAALIASATTADAVRALEKLMNRAPAKGADPAPVAQDDWATIDKLMLSDAYSGREDQRDPEVVKRVNRYFENGGKRGGK